MYAIVKTGGKQYRVERGQRLLVERLPDQVGASVALQPMLYRSEDTVFDPEGLEKVKVTATVVDHVRGQKLRVFKFKPKRGYRRRTGHRQELTRIEVTDISFGGEKTARPRTASKAAPKRAAAGTSGRKPSPVRSGRASGAAKSRAGETGKTEEAGKTKEADNGS